MADTYDINEFGEVVPFTAGRKDTDTNSYREATGFELQLIEEKDLLEKEKQMLDELNKQLEQENERQAQEMEVLRARACWGLCDYCKSDCGDKTFEWNGKKLRAV